MAEVIIPPEETEPELPEEQLPQVEKPTEKSKVISVDFNPLNTKQTTSLDTRESFYTTDTDAWIVLNVGDMNEPTGQYSLALINKEDGSIFQRTGDIVQGVAYYKLLPNEIKHAGRWVGQAVITLDNGQTTASRFSFNVSGHILDGKDVREIVIQDFQTLMAQLNDLKDNATNEFSFLKSEIEAFQTTIQASEDERQATELGRVAAEIIREENYETKVTAAIVEADVVEKVDNKVAELAPTIQQVTAQLAETIEDVNRATSELTVDSEVIFARGDELVLDDRLNKMDVEIATPDEDVVVSATNLITNGGFESTSNLEPNFTIVGTGVTGIVKDTLFYVGGTKSQKLQTTTPYSGLVQSIKKPLPNDIIYISVYVKSDARIQLNSGNSEIISRVVSNTSFTKISLNAVWLSNWYGQIGISTVVAGTLWVDTMLGINLTATFGAGNEPTVAQMDNLMKQFPNSWFDGTVNIYNSKHMMGMFFKELTKLNNAVIALGGNV